MPMIGARELGDGLRLMCRFRWWPAIPSDHVCIAYKFSCETAVQGKAGRIVSCHGQHIGAPLICG